MATLLTAITNSDWQLVARSNDLAIQGAVLVRKVPYINAANGLTLATTQEASASESSPYASGVSHTGTFAKARVELQEGTGDRDDGNARYNVLVETLIKVATVADVNALAALTSRPADAHEIRNLFGFEEGDGYTRGFVWDNIAANQRDECMALTADNLLKRVMFADNVDDWATATAYTSSPLSLVVNDDVVYSCYSAHTSEAQWEPGTGANWTDKWHEYGAAWASGAAYKTGEVSTSGGFFYVALSNHTAGANFAADYEVTATKWRRFWEFADARFDVLENNTGRFSILFKRSEWTNTWDGADFVSDVNASGTSATQVHTASGMDAGAAVGAWDNSATADSGYGVVGRQRIAKPDGEYEVSRTQKSQSETTDGTDALITKFGDAGDVIRRYFPRRTAAAAAIMVGAGGAAVSDFTYDGKTYTRTTGDASDNGDGTYDVTQVGVNNASATSYNDGSMSYKWKQTRINSGTKEYRDNTITTYWNFRTDPSACWTAINSDLTASDYVYQPPRVRQVHKYMWMITASKVVFGVWTAE